MAEIPDSHRDLLDAPVAALGTIGPDGRPQVTLVWFVHDEGKVRISLNDSRQKVKNLRARPEASLLIFDPGNPYRYVELRGDATIEPDADRSLVAEVEAKYSADLSEHDAPGQQRLAVTIEPVKVNAWGD